MNHQVLTSSLKRVKNDASKKLLSLTLLVFSSSLLTFCNAQTWISMDTGAGGEIMSEAVYNGKLIAGGRMVRIGLTTVYNIAQWNDTAWSPLGDGLRINPGEPLPIDALTTYNGNLIAGGEFDSAGTIGAKNIAQWNGVSWSAMGTGFNYWTYALCVYNGNLYAGGGFDSSGNSPVSGLAEWNGTKWVSVGGGLFLGNYPPSVYALTVYNGKLIVTGNFDSVPGLNVNGIAAWDGTSWSALGANAPVGINTLIAYNGNLIAGGEFDSAGGNPAKYIAQWNGSTWSALGSSISAHLPTFGVLGLTVYNNDLIAGGQFDSAGGIQANYIARWNGSTWADFGSGINRAFPRINYYRVNALTVYNKKLVAGGSFDTAGGMFVRDIAEWCDTCKPLSVGEIGNDKQAAVLFPNPNNGRFTIQLANSYQLMANSSVVIYNMLGEAVYSQIQPQTPKGALITIDLGAKVPGVYMYRIISETGEQIANGKFIIE